MKAEKLDATKAFLIAIIAKEQVGFAKVMVWNFTGQNRAMDGGRFILGRMKLIYLNKLFWLSRHVKNINFWIQTSLTWRLLLVISRNAIQHIGIWQALREASSLDMKLLLGHGMRHYYLIVSRRSSPHNENTLTSSYRYRGFISHDYYHWW